jgi:hypothetical protein
MATVDGMNVFAAAIILYQMSVTDFLDLSAEARLNEFGPLVGVPRMVGILYVGRDMIELHDAYRNGSTT